MKGILIFSDDSFFDDSLKAGKGVINSEKDDRGTF